MVKAKPFIKWVGGKSQLIEQLDAQLPAAILWFYVDCKAAFWSFVWRNWPLSTCR